MEPGREVEKGQKTSRIVSWNLESVSINSWVCFTVSKLLLVSKKLICGREVEKGQKTSRIVPWNLESVSINSWVCFTVYK